MEDYWWKIITFFVLSFLIKETNTYDSYVLELQYFNIINLSNVSQHRTIIHWFSMTIFVAENNHNLKNIIIFVCGFFNQL